MYKAANRRPNRWLNVLGAVTVIAAATGCGSGDQVKQKEGGTAGGRLSGYKVSMFTGQNMKRFDVPPPTAAAGAAKKKASKSGDASEDSASERLGGPSDRLAVIDRVEANDAGDGHTVEHDEFDLSTTDKRQYALMVGAAYECGMFCTHRHTCGDGEQDLDTWYPQWQAAPKMDAANVHIFEGAYMTDPHWRGNWTCERKLLLQEMLVCMAEKLVNLTESVAPVVWEKV